MKTKDSGLYPFQVFWWILLVWFFVMAFGCASMQPLPPQEVVLTIKTPEPSTIEVADSNAIQMHMELPNQEGKLSGYSFICQDRAFIKLFSGFTVSDVTNLWNDFAVLEHNTTIRSVDLFISSPGGDAFSGLALADQIERARRKGFVVTAHASGIIASAAIPVFGACTHRRAAPGTIFMVHEAALWKWPGMETASDIRAQGELLDLIRERYMDKMAKYTTLSKEEWAKMEGKTTWFSVEQAKEFGLVDAIE